MFQIDLLIPTPLRDDSVESRRRARLLIWAVSIACLSTFMASLMLVTIGFPATAVRVLFVLLPTLGVYFFFRYTRSLVWSGHLFVWMLFFATIFRYGEDGGYSVLVVTVLPMAAANLIGVRAGISWTVICVLWSAVLAPYYFRAEDFTLGLSLSAAIMTIVIGVASTIIELTRSAASREADENARRLLQHQEWLRNFAESAFQGIAEVGADGTLAESEGFESLLGYSAGSFSGNNILEYIHPESVPLLENRLGKSNPSGFRLEARVRHAEGHWNWVEIYGVPQGDTSPGRMDWLIAVRDIQSEQISRDQLAQAQRLESMGVLTAGIAHDFNNLLMVITGFAELLPEGTPRESILFAADEAAALTTNMMAFGNSGPISNESVDAAVVLDQMRPVFKSVLKQGVNLDVDLPEEPLIVGMARSQLSQILLNLVTNAREAITDQGSVAIKAETVSLDDESATAMGVLSGDFVCVRVSDSGSGFSDASINRAFDPFYSTKEKKRGSGLGLTSSYGIVQQARGSIRIDSTEGKGASVTVYLPKLMDAAEPEEKVGSVTEPDGPNGRILVVEDDPKVRQLLAAILNSIGYTMELVDSGQAALDWLKHSTADLVITDIMMPQMRGTELATMIREEYPELPILFISGYADTDIGEWRDGGAQDVRFLAKPFRRNELIESVRMLAPAISQQSI